MKVKRFNDEFSESCEKLQNMLCASLEIEPL